MHSNDPHVTSSESATRFDLIDIVQTLQRKWRTVLLLTLLAAVLGAVTYFLTAKKYKASAEIFVTNPQYADRNRLFADQQTYFIDYFADENTNDRALVIAKSDNAKSQIIYRNKLNEVYGLDTSKRSDEAALGKRFKGAYEAKRTEYGSLLISFTDKDPERAANVANDAVQVIESIFHNFFSEMRKNIVHSLNQKIHTSDSVIAILTDSLAGMRDRSGVYDLVSPNRRSMAMGTVRSTNGRAIEEIQNVESLKDQYVADRARYTSLAGEFSTGIEAGDMPILQVMSPAYVPENAAGLGALLTILACALGGFIFAALWVLLSTYFRRLASVQR
jgi:hypothetical protein